MKSTLILFLCGLPLLAAAQTATQLPVTFTGGHDTDGRDRGRPVVLIAAALGVPAEVFREAFTHVHPAGPGEGGPTDERARENKQALMAALGPYGVTDDRLNEVSNYYRYSRSQGEMWRNRPAVALAFVRDGVVTSILITDPGAGYSSPPAVTVPGMTSLNAIAVIAFGTDLAANGSVRSVAVRSSP